MENKNIDYNITYNPKSYKQNLGWILALVLFIILIVVGGWYLENLISEKVYIKGFADGQVNVINSIQNTGNIPYLETANNQTTIKTISITQLCNQGG